MLRFMHSTTHPITDNLVLYDVSPRAQPIDFVVLDSDFIQCCLEAGWYLTSVTSQFLTLLLKAFPHSLR